MRQTPQHMWPYLLRPLHPIYHCKHPAVIPRDNLTHWSFGERKGLDVGGDPSERKRKSQTQQQLLHVLVDKYHRLILNPHPQHGSQRRSHRSLLVSDPLLQLDPPAMAYVPILQMTVRQPSVRLLNCLEQQ